MQADEEQRASGCLGLFPGSVHDLEKLRRLQAESGNDFEDVYQCQMVLASFDAAHLAAVNATGIPESFLRVAQCLVMLTMLISIYK